MKKIKKIWYVIAEGFAIYYEVGKNEITDIIPALKKGQMAEITYYKIYKNNEHFSDLHEFTEMIYETKGGNNG